MQFTKTIKMALMSTEGECAILRARSTVQRFPVVEWRQRMEDFRRRSVAMSRGVAGKNTFRTSDCDGGGSFVRLASTKIGTQSIKHSPSSQLGTRTACTRRQARERQDPQFLQASGVNVQ